MLAEHPRGIMRIKIMNVEVCGCKPSILAVRRSATRIRVLVDGVMVVDLETNVLVEVVVVVWREVPLVALIMIFIMMMVIIMMVMMTMMMGRGRRGR